MNRRTAILDRPRAKHNELVAQLNRATLKRDEAIASLIRIENKRVSLIRAVSRSQKRLAKAATLAEVNAPVDLFQDDPQVVETPAQKFERGLTAELKSCFEKAKANPPSDAISNAEAFNDLGIPAFLDRRLNEADEKAKVEITTQQETSAKKKASARIAKLKADKSGERKRMPLSGKAAQDFINQA